MHSSIARRSVGAIIAVAIAVSGGTAAQASGSDPTSDAVSRVVGEASPFADIAVAPEVTSRGLEIDTAEGAVLLPHSASGAVVIDAAAGVAPLAIDLPDVDAATADVASDGTVVYSSGGAVDLAVQADGSSARIHTVLNDASAPDEYRYTIAGVTPELQSDGTVVLTGDAEGVSVDFAEVAAPWAYDAEGRPVPTSYRIEGDAIVQELDLSGDISFPVVADPWIQADCGIITCTVRFNRATTRNIRDGVNITAIAAGVATYWSGPAAPAVGVLAAVLGINGVFAGRYYENGNCFGIKVVPASIGTVNAWWPTQVTRNTYNCS